MQDRKRFSQLKSVNHIEARSVTWDCPQHSTAPEEEHTVAQRDQHMLHHAHKSPNVWQFTDTKGDSKDYYKQ